MRYEERGTKGRLKKLKEKRGRRRTDGIPFIKEMRERSKEKKEEEKKKKTNSWSRRGLNSRLSHLPVILRQSGNIISTTL